MDSLAPAPSAVPGADAGLGVRLAVLAAGELFGGVERQVLDLCTYACRRQGVHPSLLLFHDLELAARARGLGIEPVILSAPHRYAPSLATATARSLAAARANVVHVHGYKAMIVSAWARRSSRCGCGVVKTEHGQPEPSRRKGLGWLKSRVNHRLGVMATRWSSPAVAYVTRDLAERYAVAHRGLSRTVIPNGIDPLDPEDFPRPRELEVGRVELGIVGRLTEVKGIATALRAVAAQGLPASLRLNLIGSGPSEPDLRSQAAALGLKDTVRFLGFRRNVLEFVAHLDGLLMPSLHEGLPYTLLEAMSLGVPIIASRVGGLKEVLRDGETALLVPPCDADALSAAVMRIVADRPFARRLGAAAAVLQRQDYTLERMGRRYWELYQWRAGAAKGEIP